MKITWVSDHFTSQFNFTFLGTGSASLSHSIIRSILPNGHLYTFEFHKERAQKAEEELKDHGLSDYVTVTHKDVCKFGFDLEDVADAVFLDLPVPWDALPSAKKALKKLGGFIRCTSYILLCEFKVDRNKRCRILYFECL